MSSSTPYNIASTFGPANGGYAVRTAQHPFGNYAVDRRLVYQNEMSNLGPYTSNQSGAAFDLANAEYAANTNEISSGAHPVTAQLNYQNEMSSLDTFTSSRGSAALGPRNTGYAAFNQDSVDYNTFTIGQVATEGSGNSEGLIEKTTVSGSAQTAAKISNIDASHGQYIMSPCPPLNS